MVIYIEYTNNIHMIIIIKTFKPLIYKGLNSVMFYVYYAVYTVIVYIGVLYYCVDTVIVLDSWYNDTICIA